MKERRDQGMEGEREEGREKGPRDGGREEGRERKGRGKKSKKEKEGRKREGSWKRSGKRKGMEWGLILSTKCVHPYFSFGCVSTDREDQSILCT